MKGKKKRKGVRKMVYTRDSEGNVQKCGRARPATAPTSRHGEIMQNRSDDRLREMIRALDERERKIVWEVLNEA